MPALIDRESIQKAMSKQMSRRDFLRNIGLLVLAIFGVTSMLDTLLQTNHKQSGTKHTIGFGGGKYGA